MFCFVCFVFIFWAAAAGFQDFNFCLSFFLGNLYVCLYRAVSISVHVLLGSCVLFSQYRGRAVFFFFDMQSSWYRCERTHTPHKRYESCTCFFINLENIVKFFFHFTEFSLSLFTDFIYFSLSFSAYFLSLFFISIHQYFLN